MVQHYAPKLCTMKKFQDEAKNNKAIRTSFPSIDKLQEQMTKHPLQFGFELTFTWLAREETFLGTLNQTLGTKNLFTSEISTTTVIQYFRRNSQQLLKWQEIRLCHDGPWRIQRNLPISIFNNCSPKTGSDFWMGRHSAVLWNCETKLTDFIFSQLKIKYPKIKITFPSLLCFRYYDRENFKLTLSDCWLR